MGDIGPVFKWFTLFVCLQKLIGITSLGQELTAFAAFAFRLMEFCSRM
jgi:hypothetical protein